MMHYMLARLQQESLKESQPVTDKVSDVAQELPAVTMTSQAHLRPIKEVSLFSAVPKSIFTLTMQLMTPW